MKIVTAITYKYLNYYNFQKFRKANEKYLTFVTSDDIRYIDKPKIKICNKSLGEYYQHNKHPGGTITVYDTVLKKYIDYNVTITHKNSNITIREKSLIDQYYNLTYEFYENIKTIKITDNLYISECFGFTEITYNPLGNLIKPAELKFDANKGYYVYEYEHEGVKYLVDHPNLTIENTEKIKNILETKIQNNEIRQIDLTNHINLEESLFMYQLLQLKAYEEPEEKGNAIEQEGSQKLKYDEEQIKAYSKDKENKEMDNKNKLDE